MNEVTMIGSAMVSFKDATGNPTKMQSHKSTIMLIGDANNPDDRHISVYMIFEGLEWSEVLKQQVNSKRAIMARLEYEANDYVISHSDRILTSMTAKDRLDIMENAVSELVELVKLSCGVPSEDDAYWETVAGQQVIDRVDNLISHGRAFNLSHNAKRLNFKMEGHMQWECKITTEAYIDVLIVEIARNA